MRTSRRSLAPGLLVAAAVWLGVASRSAAAQGVTTASIAGVVSDEHGRGVADADIEVTHQASGVATHGRSRADGRFVVLGLPAGGPYAVQVRRIGFRAHVRDGLMLSLGQTARLDFVLETTPTELAPVTVEARADPAFTPSRTGVEATITDGLLHRLPTVDRDLYAFLGLVPQLSNRFGASAAGVNYRFNSYQVDGAMDQAVYGGNPAAGGRAVSIEAVQEYQVVLSSYDVRHGDFAGALVNGVTRSGTNRFHGTAFVYFRNEQLARNDPWIRSSPYDRAQFGFTLGGPLMRDRAHFFLAAELQQQDAPAPGPYLGQQTGREPPVPVTNAQVDSFVRILDGYGLSGGSGGPISVSMPAANVLARIDVALPTWSSRLMLRYGYGYADSTGFARPISTIPGNSCIDAWCFPLSSMQRPFTNKRHTAVVRLSTHLPGGSYNELRFGYVAPWYYIRPPLPQPMISVTVPSATPEYASATLQAGTPETTQGYDLNQEVREFADHVTVPVGRHQLTAGLVARWWRVRNLQTPLLYGVWDFASLDSLRQGTASRYRVSADQGGADATLRGYSLAVLAGDEWQLFDHLALTLGVRIDVPFLQGAPPHSARVDSAFGRRTDVIPSGSVLWSPRLGFNWRLPGTRLQHVRGGAGLFAGRPPLGWLLQPFQSYGQGLAQLTCSAASGHPPPPFPSEPDYRTPPHACGDGFGFAAAAGQVNFVDEALRFPQTVRATLGYDRQLPGGIVATVEGLYTRALEDFLFLNANLGAPVGTDPHGRTMYGSLDPQTGVATPAWVAPAFANVDVTELRNQSRNYSYGVTLQLAMRMDERIEMRAAYAFTKARDVQTHYPFTINAGNEWRAQANAGRQDDLTLDVSGFDQPHRIVLVGVVRAPWRSWQTELSVAYVGASGTPHTYVVTGGSTAAGRRGDLNADGSNVNDPIYVPLSALDTAEIRFAGTTQAPVATQQSAFEAFIEDTPCLREHRGRILARNSCRSPWAHSLNIALRQALPGMADRGLAVVVEVFNLLNLLNRDWGAVNAPYSPSGRTVTPELLTHVGQRGDQPVFTFDPTRPRWSAQNSDSYYQIQLSARYSF